MRYAVRFLRFTAPSGRSRHLRDTGTVQIPFCSFGDETLPILHAALSPSPSPFPWFSPLFPDNCVESLFPGFGRIQLPLLFFRRAALRQGILHRLLLFRRKARPGNSFVPSSFLPVSIRSRRVPGRDFRRFLRQGPALAQQIGKRISRPSAVRFSGSSFFPSLPPGNEYGYMAVPDPVVERFRRKIRSTVLLPVTGLPFGIPADGFINIAIIRIL